MIFEIDREYLDLVIKLAVEWNLRGVEDLTLKKEQILTAELQKAGSEYQIEQKYNLYSLSRRKVELSQSSDYLRIISILRKYKNEVFKNECKN